MQNDGWKCAGCGKPSPDREESCDCPTRVVSRGNGQTAWKLPAGTVATSQRCHDLIGRLYENPLTPLEAGDVDLVKAALKQYAERP